MGKDELPKYVEFIAVERMYNQIAEQIDADDGVVTAKDIEHMVKLFKEAGFQARSTKQSLMGSCAQWD